MNTKTDAELEKNVRRLVEEMQEDISILYMKLLLKLLDREREANRILVEALEFYADIKHWKGISVPIGNGPVVNRGDAINALKAAAKVRAKE